MVNKGFLVRIGFGKLVLTCILLWCGLAGPAVARENAAQPLVAAVPLVALPLQGQETYARILQGGPFPFEKDGVTFFNRERLLPLQKRGYYREYTVKTPGSKNRGTRRIVCGGAPTRPDACYYTADHYASFRRIVP